MCIYVYMNYICVNIYIYIYIIYINTQPSNLASFLFLSALGMGSKRYPQNVVLFLQYYAASQPKRATTLNCTVVQQTWS